MMNREQRRSPNNQNNPSRETRSSENGDNLGGVFSPRFKSAAALAGWDEESLLFASLVVQDTPDRVLKNDKHFDLNIKTPTSNSRRKRRAQRSPLPIPVTVLDLEQDETPRKDNVKKMKENRTTADEAGGNILTQNNSGSSSSGSALPCIDKLREELSCAICLEICFEPSTTPCGHSFCRKCLRSAADKCGRKCPKCRQLISNGRSCNVNTVLWNTIQLLFPKEVEARKAAGALNKREAQQRTISETAFYDNLSISTFEGPGRSTRSQRRRVVITTTTQDEDEYAALAIRLQREENGVVQNNNNNSRSLTSSSSSSSSSRGISRRRITSQDEDAALALRLQREEFMQAFRGSQARSETSGSMSMSSARANLRAMASRAINLRIRDRRS
ncbi:hypothetical protein QN277_013684 [Acacia crassicarpa]|uniref:RING-type E3 ubiquitin transferase n=1 Tax=Acacia crassicarpa TaxID=499986 RepID=A0AAE1TEM3_9FABA|nr:hypothetical protein QN277_013684 [Acacia crassicarpa]